MELDKVALDRHITGNYGEDQFRDDDPDEWEELSFCPACGQSSDYCQGHGEIGDPAGFAVLLAHDINDHSGCNVHGCEEAYNIQMGWEA